VHRLFAESFPVKTVGGKVVVDESGYSTSYSRDCWTINGVDNPSYACNTLTLTAGQRVGVRVAFRNDYQTTTITGMLKLTWATAGMCVLSSSLPLA
jgi:hypothetical protein